MFSHKPQALAPAYLPQLAGGNTLLLVTSNFFFSFLFWLDKIFSFLEREKLFWNNSGLCLSRKSIACHRFYLKTFLNCVLVEIHLHLNEIILTPFWVVSEPKFNCIWWRNFQDHSKMYRSWNWFASRRIYSKTIPNWVLAEINHMHHPGWTTRRNFNPLSTYKIPDPTSVAVRCNFAKIQQN